MSSNNKLQLYRGFPDRGTYVWSPFVTKLELRLRHGNIPYDYHHGSTRSGPKGKIPYVDISGLYDLEEPEFVGDSSLIAKRLMKDGKLQDLNSKLSADDKLADLAIRALLEDKLNFYNSCERFSMPTNFYVQRDKILSTQPWIMRVIIGNIIYRNIQQMVQSQGAGRHSPEEQQAIRREIYDTIAEKLEVSRRKQQSKETDQPFWILGGKEPSEADTTVFGYLCSALMCQSCPDSQSIVKDLPVLIDYANRIHQRYFPDYEKWNE